MKFCNDCKFCKPDTGKIFFSVVSGLGSIGFVILGVGISTKFEWVSIFFYLMAGIYFALSYRSFRSRFSFSRCNRYYNFDLVTGKKVIKSSFCDLEREYKCGAEAKFFQPKTRHFFKRKNNINHDL